MNPDARLLDENKENTGYKKLTADQENTLWTTKVVLTFLSAVSAGVALGLVLSDDSFTLVLFNLTVFRNGPTLLNDGYPAPAIIGANSAESSFPPVDVGLVAAFISVLAFVGYLFVLIFHKTEMQQLARGSNPYFFIFSSFWTPIAFLTFGFVSGVQDLFVLTYISLFTWVWLDLFWADDLLHSYAYEDTKRRADDIAATIAAQSGTEVVVSSGTMWSWLPYGQGLFFLIANYVIIFVYLGFVFGAPVQPPNALLSIPIATMIVYLGIPIIILVRLSKVALTSLYAREMWLYIYSFVVVVLATWLSIGLFAGLFPIPSNTLTP